MKLKKIINRVGIFCLIINILIINGYLLLTIISYSNIGLTDKDVFFMNEAYKEAIKSFNTGKFPVGAILVMNNSIISKGYHGLNCHNYLCEHAEVIAINNALNKFEKEKFEEKDEVILYSTYEPCKACKAFINKKKISKVIVGKKKNTLKNIIYNIQKDIKYKLNMRTGINSYIQSELISNFNLIRKNNL